MQTDDIAHLGRRAEQHRLTAKNADIPEVAAIHATLAAEYARLLAIEDETLPVN